MNQVFGTGLTFDDLLLIPRYSKIISRSEVDISSSLTPNIKLKIPIISSNMSDITGVKMAITLGKLGALGVLPRFVTPEEEANNVEKIKKEKLIAAASVGCKKGEFERAEKLVKAGVDILVLDVAHGHMEQHIKMTKKIKAIFGKKVEIISGNVATYQGACDLFKAGADALKVGIGPGSVCITRVETGFGVPQMTAVFETVRAAHKYNKTVICDGGMKSSGDIVKALAAGASAVMTGCLFAGTKEAPGKVITKKGKKYKTYNGSTSLNEKISQLKKVGKVVNANFLNQIEGVESIVPFKGPVSKVLEKYCSNIRSGFSYCGAKNIKVLWQRAKFMQITSISLKENGSHDVIVNYGMEKSKKETFA
ncbi:MAG: guanosine monophosphate reductase [Patescibacteria group bacterium]|nr:guanosine monophosphate reductase [Patescibacteria group bacterium]